ncbi:MAG TPA: phospholipase D-like domain-containing protein, partial [Nevskia sp.]|nr:phospholipase D-like domain-containing protein [Nevskia sp.]
DDDVFAAGPIAQKLSATFDEFWNSDLSIPAEALGGGMLSRHALDEHREDLKEQSRQMKSDGVDYVKRVAAGEPFNGIVSGRLPLVWAHAQVVCDSPDKKQVENGEMVGRLMHRAVAKAAMAVQSELLMITPYLIPGDEGLQLFKDLHQRKVRVRILTSSLESATVLAAQSGYRHYRVPLLESGVELYEIRSLLGNTRGSGETKAISRYGNYSLHAKLFVFDRQRLFIGSMNFDQRSMHLNTEIGLIIDSPVLAQQIAARFEAMVQPVNSYRLGLSPNEAGGSPGLVWHTREGTSDVDYDTEPARSGWQRTKVWMLALLPLDGEL